MDSEGMEMTSVSILGRMEVHSLVNLLVMEELKLQYNQSWI